MSFQICYFTSSKPYLLHPCICFSKFLMVTWVNVAPSWCIGVWFDGIYFDYLLVIPESTIFAISVFKVDFGAHASNSVVDQCQLRNSFYFWIGQIYPPINVLPSLSRLMKVSIALICWSPWLCWTIVFRQSSWSVIIVPFIFSFGRVPLVRGWHAEIILMCLTRSDFMVVVV